MNKPASVVPGWMDHGGLWRKKIVSFAGHVFTCFVWYDSAANIWRGTAEIGEPTTRHIFMPTALREVLMDRIELYIKGMCDNG